MTDELIVSAANGAGGFISNVFEHKINKIKDYFLEKELAKDIEPENISNSLSLYFEKLSKRVSEITTVAFPQHKLDFVTIYEPLNLIEINKSEHIEGVALGNGKAQPFDIVNQLKNESGAYIIIDSAGMGKTTFSRYLVHEILYKSEKIPILFDLRKINEGADLIELLAKELDFPWKTFSRDLFYRLLAINKFIIILDGFDEVAPSNQEYVANQIHTLSSKCCDNSILLTSRPQEGLPDIINSNVFKFEELNVEQVKSLLLRYDKCASSSVGKNLIEQLDKVPQNFLKTPLIVSLLYKTFGFNNSIADRLCTFYDDVYQALYKGHDLINKGGFCRKKMSNLDYEDFRKLVRGFCYLMTVCRVVSFTDKNDLYSNLDKAIRLTGIKPSSNSHFLTDLLVSVPLMTKEGNEYKFIHKTILEYFSAEYIVYHSASKEKLSLMLRSESFSSFSKIMDFVYDINASLYNKVITRNLATVAYEKINFDNLLNNLITSCMLLYDIKIGIFDLPFLNKVMDNHKTVFYESNFKTEREQIALHFSLADNNIMGYMSYAARIRMNSNVFYFGIARKDKKDSLPFHHYAYNEICEKYSYKDLFDILGVSVLNQDHGHALKEYSDEILNTIESNKWFDFHERTPFISWGRDIIINGIIDAVFMSVDESNNSFAHIVSKKKIEIFLDELKKEDQLEREIETLL